MSDEGGAWRTCAKWGVEAPHTDRSETAGWHTRMSSRLAGKGVCACLCAGFQHPALAVASILTGGDAVDSAAIKRGADDK